MTKQIKAVISVVVPVYRTEAYLSRCVDSLLAQSGSGYTMELILVDDGSPDGCGRLCDEYARKDSRVKVIHKENGGLVSAWQAGVKAGTGSYICFVDSDDWVEPCMLEEMAKRLTGRDKEVVCCNFLLEKSKGVQPHSHAAAPGIYEGERLAVLKDNLLGYENRRVSLSRCMKLISRSLLTDNIKYCDLRIRMGEDVNIMLPLLLDAERVVILEEAYYYHYFHLESSMAHKYDRDLYQGIVLLYQTIKNICLDKGRIGADEQCAKEYIHLLLLAVKNEIRGNKKGCLRAIRDIAEEGETKRVLSLYQVTVKDPAGRILYGVLKSPSRPRILTARGIFLLHSKMTPM